MLQNITLSADKELIERARQHAKEHNTTLNSEFRRWLTQYADKADSAAHLAELMDQFKYAKPGKTFSRAELNDR